MLTIRAAQPADLPNILGLIRELASYEKLLHEVAASSQDLRAALFCEHPRVFCDIAEWSERDQKQTAGIALWFYNYSTFRGRHGIYLEDLFVRPQLRGKGIGKALLLTLVQRCAAERLGRLEWAVLDWNEPAIRFYKSLGAKPLNEWTVFRMTGDALKP